MKKRLLAMLLSGMTMVSMLGTPVHAKEGEAAQDPVTLSIGFLVADASVGEGIHSDYQVLAEIEKQTGVTLNYVTYDAEKFKLLAAGGDLPDIYEAPGDETTFRDLVSSGSVMALDDLLDAYGGNIKANIPTAIEWAKATYGDGEHTYLLPTNTSAQGTVPLLNSGLGFGFRFDIYEAIGTPEMNGEDDFIDVLKQMQDYERERTGSSDIYALSSWTDSGLWPYIIPYPFNHGYTNLDNNHSLNLVIGEAEDNWLNKESVLWKAFRFYNKAYQMGLFDPDGFTQKNSQYWDKVNKGKVLCSATIASGLSKADCGENAVSAVPKGAFPIVCDVYTASNPLGYRLACARVMNANCSNPERAMQLWNYLDSEAGARLLMNGVQGVHWDYVDGVPQFIGEMADATVNGSRTQYILENKVGGSDIGVAFMYSGTVAGIEYPIKIEQTEKFLMENATKAEQHVAKYYNEELTYPGQVYESWIEEGVAETVNNGGIFASYFAPALSEESVYTGEKASSYIEKNVAKIIMAEAEEFDSVQDEIVEELKNMGYESYETEYQNGIAEGQKTLDALTLE